MYLITFLLSSFSSMANLSEIIFLIPDDEIGKSNGTNSIFIPKSSFL